MEQATDDGARMAATRGTMFTIEEDDLASDDVRALLALHLSGMHANSPPGHVFALDLGGLRGLDVTVWAVRRDGALAAIGALRMLGDGGGELKSMRTHPDHLRTGAATALLLHMIAEARRRGLVRLSLETGSGPSFAPAIALYRRHGFRPGESFADYRQSAFNQFFHLAL